MSQVLQTHQYHSATHVRCGRQTTDVITSEDPTCKNCMKMRGPESARNGRGPQWERATNDPRFKQTTLARIGHITNELTGFIGEIGDGRDKDALFEAIGFLANIGLDGTCPTPA